MAAGIVQGVGVTAQRLRINAHRAAHPLRNRHADFVKGDFQMVAAPRQLARTNAQVLGAALDAALAALGHGPAALAGAVQRHVDGAVVVRLHG